MTHRSVPAMVIAAALGFGAFADWGRTSELSAAQAVNRPSGWKESSHGSGARPDYARLFGMDTVHEIGITISAENYRAMQEDLQTIGIGRGGGRGPGGFPPGGPGGFPPGGQGGFPPGGPGGFPPGGPGGFPPGGPGGFPPGGPGGFGPPPGGGDGFGRGGMGPIRLTTRDPMYVPVTVQFDGSTWTSVGMRYKGNSTLMTASMSGTKKTPFRLDFDRYEDERPEIGNQRMYGFSKLTFSSNANDASMLHEVMATEVFRDRGVPAPRAAFYRVFVDAGSGPEYWGLYSMIEDPSDGAMLDAQFGSHSGNLYKPDGPGATWVSFDAESFEKKNNKKQADWSDVSAAIAALHAPQNDRRAWRAALEARFDVDLFLKWLAVNTAIDNWDVYGTMAHNYYLYADPGKNSQLRWIPWDNNEAFGRSGGPGRGGPGGGGRGDFFVFGPGGPPPDGQRPGGPAGPGGPGGFGGPGGPGGPGQRFGGPGSNDDVMHARIGSQWPLIRILLDDEVYAARYREHLRHALGGLFAPDAAAKRMRELHSLISRAAIDDPTVSRAAFEQSVDGPGGMIEFVKRRHEQVRAALDGATGR